ncbi:hypothetical protein AAC387_Pa10g0736 [Persea americana]
MLFATLNPFRPLVEPSISHVILGHRIFISSHPTKTIFLNYPSPLPRFPHPSTTPYPPSQSPAGRDPRPASWPPSPSPSFFLPPPLLYFLSLSPSLPHSSSPSLPFLLPAAGEEGDRAAGRGRERGRENRGGGREEERERERGELPPRATGRGPSPPETGRVG